VFTLPPGFAEPEEGHRCLGGLRKGEDIRIDIEEGEVTIHVDLTCNGNRSI